MKINIVFEQEDFELFTVDFEAEPSWTNDGIGSYEFRGQKCFDKGYDYVTLDSYGTPTYNESLYTPEQIKIIDEYLKSEGGRKLEEDFCDRYTEESKEY